MVLPSPLPLENPPITEALLDVQVTFPQIIDAERLKELGATLHSAYPIIRPQFMATVQFQTPTPIAPAINQSFRGYSFLSSDSKEIVQFRIDGFTFNRLAPYTSWEDMHTKAAEAWRHYHAGLPDGKVTRVATRFLNRILVPLHEGRVELDDYFAVGTKDPHDETLFFLSFISHQRFLDSKTGFGANINLTMQQTEREHLPVILDIDVFTQEPGHLAAAEPFSILTTMREVKNRLFLRSLTPKALELFK